MKKVCILLVLITQEFAWCMHLSLARMLHARGTYFLTGPRKLNPQKCGRKRGVTEESNPKSQALHVRIDSLYEHWKRDICCADWQKPFRLNHEHCRRHNCGTQPLYFPVITQRRRTNHWTMSQTGKRVDCPCLNIERRSERQFPPHSKHTYADQPIMETKRDTRPPGTLCSVEW